jgi:transcriptional regulator with XRE-family HTH domain
MVFTEIMLTIYFLGFFVLSSLREQPPRKREDGLARVELGERIATLREEQTLTQADLAERARISPSTLSQIESGRVPRPHVGTIRKIARALGVEPQELRRAEEPALPLAKGPGAGPSHIDAVYEEAIEEFNERHYGPSIIAQGWDRLTERWTQRLERGDVDLRKLEIFLETLEDLAMGMEANAASERKELVASYGPEAARDMSLLRPAINRLGLLVGEILEETKKAEALVEPRSNVTHLADRAEKEAS